MGLGRSPYQKASLGAGLCAAENSCERVGRICLGGANKIRTVGHASTVAAVNLTGLKYEEIAVLLEILRPVRSGRKLYINTLGR